MKKVKIKCGWHTCPGSWKGSCSSSRVSLIKDPKRVVMAHPWCPYGGSFENEWNKYSPMRMVDFSSTSLMAVKQFFE